MEKLYILQDSGDGMYFADGNWKEPSRERSAHWFAMSANEAMRTIAILQYGKCPLADRVKIIPLTHKEIKEFHRLNSK